MQRHFWRIIWMIHLAHLNTHIQILIKVDRLIYTTSIVYWQVYLLVTWNKCIYMTWKESKCVAARHWPSCSQTLALFTKLESSCLPFLAFHMVFTHFKVKKKYPLLIALTAVSYSKEKCEVTGVYIAIRRYHWHNQKTSRMKECGKPLTLIFFYINRNRNFRHNKKMTWWEPLIVHSL